MCCLVAILCHLFVTWSSKCIYYLLISTSVVAFLPFLFLEFLATELISTSCAISLVAHSIPFCAIETCWYVYNRHTHSHIFPNVDSADSYIRPQLGLGMRHNAVVFPPIWYPLFAACILWSAMLAEFEDHVSNSPNVSSMQEFARFIRVLGCYPMDKNLWLLIFQKYIIGDSTCRGVVQLKLLYVYYLLGTSSPVGHCCACPVLSYSFHLHFRKFVGSVYTPPPYFSRLAVSKSQDSN